MATKLHGRPLGVLFAAILCMHPAAHAAEPASLDLFTGKQAKIGRLGFQWNWNTQWLKTGDASVGGYWDASVFRWREEHYQSPLAHASSLNDMGLSAVLRYQRNNKSGFYAEAGSGPYYLADLNDTEGRRYSHRFIFNSHAGIGFIWKNGLDLGFKAMHISQGGVKQPHEPNNIIEVGLRYRW